MKHNRNRRSLLLTGAMLGVFSLVGCSHSDTESGTTPPAAPKSANADAAAQGGTRGTVPPHPKLDTGQ